MDDDRRKAAHLALTVPAIGALGRPGDCGEREELTRNTVRLLSSRFMGRRGIRQHTLFHQPPASPDIIGILEPLGRIVLRLQKPSETCRMPITNFLRVVQLLPLPISTTTVQSFLSARTTNASLQLC